MIVSILITIIAFVAAIFIMKKQIDEETKKQDDKNKELMKKVKDDLGKSIQTKENLDNIAKSVKNTLEFDQTRDIINKNIDKNVKDIQQVKSIYGDYIKSNLDSITNVKSNVNIIESDVQSNLNKFREVDRELSEVANTVARLGESIESINVRLLDSESSNVGSIDDIKETINEIISSNNQLFGSNNIDSSDLNNMKTDIENINNVMSNLDLESINSNISLLDEQFKLLPDISTISSNNLQKSQDNRNALNKFFDTSDFVTQYKSAEKGMGFKQWFDSSYNIGINTTNFDNFESMIQKTDETYSKVKDIQENKISDIQTEINTVKQSLGSINIGVNPDGNIVNLQYIENILRSNADHIDVLKHSLNTAVANELSKIDGTVLANKFVGKNIQLNNLDSSGRISAKDISTDNLRITGNLNIDGKNIQNKLEEIEVALQNISSGGGGGSGSETNLTYTSDNELATQLGINHSDFVQQRSQNLLGSNITNIPQKYIHSVSGKEGNILFHEIDLNKKTSNIYSVNPSLGNISGSVLASKISGDEEASFTNGIRLGINGCLKLNEESSGKPRLDLCDKNCLTGCRKLWDHHYAPEPK